MLSVMTEDGGTEGNEDVVVVASAKGSCTAAVAETEVGIDKSF